MDKPVVSATERKRGFDLLMLLGFVAVISAFVRALSFTPEDIEQGVIQKILYVHVPAAWVMMIAFMTVGIAGILYLWLRDERLDRFGLASVEVGMVFITICLITGPIWARPVWGTYWNWGDARLTSTLVLGLVYLGYLVMRGGVEDPQLRARYSAIIGILGALLVPFVHLSVYLFDSAHPMPMAASPDAFGSDRRIPLVMLGTLMWGFGASLLLYIAFVRARMRLEVERERAAATATAALGARA